MEKHEKTNVLWFSKYKPSKEQLKSFESRNIQIVEFVKTRELARRYLNTIEDVYAVIEELKKLCASNNVSRVYGYSYPVIFNHVIATIEEPEIMLSHNVFGSHR